MAVGLAVLAVGGQVYRLDAGSTIGGLWPAHHAGAGLARAVRGWLPDLLHPMGFALLAMGLLARTRGGRWTFCLLFFGVDLAFEIGQRFPETAASLVPEAFRSIPLLSRATDYFRQGTWSPADVAAAGLGVLLAGLLGEVLKPEKDYVREEPEDDRDPR